LLDAINQSDLYIVNSQIEGFGLALLESMLNKNQWTSRHIAGGKELKTLVFHMKPKNNHSAKNKVDQILTLL